MWWLWGVFVFFFNSATHGPVRSYAAENLFLFDSQLPSILMYTLASVMISQKEEKNDEDWRFDRERMNPVRVFENVKNNREPPHTKE